MWDLQTIIRMNEEAHQRYLRKKDEKKESEKKVKVA